MADVGREHELYQQAERALQQREYDIAERYVDALLRINPHHVKAQELRREIRVDRARNGLPFGERLSMQLSTQWKLLRKRYADAIDDLELLYHRNPKQLQPALNYARTCIRLGRFKEAVEPLENAHKHHSKSHQAGEMLADVYRALQRYEDALRVLNVLVDTHPGRAEYYKKKAKDVSADYQTWQIEQERLTKARSDQERQRREQEQRLAEKERIQSLIRECAANPDNVDLKLELVDRLIETQDFTNAARVLQPICEQRKDILLWEKLARLYETTRNFQALADTYKQLQQMSSEPSKYQQPLICARLELARQNLAANPSVVAHAEHIERLEAQLRELQIHDLRVKKRANPGDHDTVLALARVLRAHRRVDDAIREYQELAQVPSYAFVASHELGRCFLDKGMDSLGIEFLETALSKLPATRGAMPEPAKQIYYTLGEYYLHRGDRQRGLPFWKKLYEADIDYRDIRERYERAFRGEDIGPLQDLRPPAPPQASNPQPAATQTSRTGS